MSADPTQFARRTTTSNQRARVAVLQKVEETTPVTGTNLNSIQSPRDFWLRVALPDLEEFLRSPNERIFIHAAITM